MADELLAEFLIEGRELVARAVDDLAALAAAPDARPRLDALFRALHTLKGSTGLFDLAPLTAVLQAAEGRLETARGRGAIEFADVGEIERALDVTDAWLDALEHGGQAGADLVRETAALAVGDDPTVAGALQATGSTPDWALALGGHAGSAGATVAVRYRPDADAYFRGDDPLAVVRGLPGLLALKLAAPAADAATYDPFRCILTLDALCAAPLADVVAALRMVSDQSEAVAIAAPAPATDPALRSLRVDAAALDRLALLVDELVIAKNGLAHAAQQLAEAAPPSLLQRELAARLAAMERVSGDLHGAVTTLRLLPLARVFARFPRQVRDIAARLGKTVEFVVSGDEVTLDKSVVEGLFEPLLHLIRNAVDHGVEAPKARAAANKPERARLTLAAHVRGEEATIELTDDGAGVDLAAVRAAAIARKIAPVETVGALSDAEALNLIFDRGFSTTGSVSEISGRGVGMDAVRDAVERLGGQVSLENRPGQGLTVRLVLPSRVLLAKVLVVNVGAERFGVPLEVVKETHRVAAGEVSDIRAGKAFVRRDTVVPLVDLGALLGLPERPPAPAFPVVAIDAEGQTVGVRVDALSERVEAPLRPLAGLLRGFPGALGTMLEGDGRVLLVLDLEALVA